MDWLKKLFLNGRSIKGWPLSGPLPRPLGIFLVGPVLEEASSGLPMSEHVRGALPVLRKAPGVTGC